MKKFRFNLALGIRLIGYILSFPTAVMYDISNLIKNKEDKFNF
jgi:hypothetical protein